MGYGIPHLALQSMSSIHFHAPGPLSPVADAAHLHLPGTADAMRPTSWPYLLESMCSLLDNVLDNIRDRDRPIVRAGARDVVLSQATELLERANETPRDDLTRLQSLRAEVIHFLDATLLPNLNISYRGVRGFTTVGVNKMGRVRYSEAFTPIILAGARNRIHRASHSDPPSSLIAATIKRLGDMSRLLMTLHGGGWGQFNIGIAMFRIGRADENAQTVDAISGTLVAISGRGRDVAMEGNLRRIREGKVVGESATRFAHAIQALSEATIAPESLDAELDAAAPTFPLLMRDGDAVNRSGALDAEYRLLANILHELRRQGIDPARAIGHVYLFTEYPVCGTCMLAIEEFKAQCPNVDLIPAQGMRYQLADEAPPQGVDPTTSWEGVAYRLDEWINAQIGRSPALLQAASDLRDALVALVEHKVPLERSTFLEAAEAVLNEFKGRRHDGLSDQERTLLHAVGEMLDAIGAGGADLLSREEQPWLFQLPPQTPVNFNARPRQGSDENRIGLAGANGQPLTLIQAGGHALFIAGELNALVAQVRIAMATSSDDARPFVKNMLLTIVQDHAVHGASPVTVVCEHNGKKHDLTYSVQGTQIMALRIDDHFEFDEAQFSRNSA